MAKQKAKFYVVWQGRDAGIYDSWAACEAQVKGVAAKYKGFATRAEAEKRFLRDSRSTFLFIVQQIASKQQQSSEGQSLQKR